MIEELCIENLGVIHQARLNLSDGFTVFTGETGAGKTMIISSLLLLLGEKADTSLVRHGADMARIEGVFSFSSVSPIMEELRNAGVLWDEEDGTVAIVIVREVPKTGRSRAYIGGRSVPLSFLKKISHKLLIVHGQTDQLLLAHASQQRELLDNFGSSSIADVYRQWNDVYKCFIDLQQRRDEHDELMSQAARNRIALEAFVSKIDELSPQVGEEQSIKNTVMYLEKEQDHYLAYMNALSVLQGGDVDATGVIDAVKVCENLIDDYATDELKERVQSLRIDIDDITRDIMLAAQEISPDMERISALHERRHKLTALRKELGMDLDDALAEAERAREQLDALEDPEEKKEQLDKEYGELLKQLEIIGNTLHTKRLECAKELAQKVNEELSSLGMSKAEVAISVEKTEPHPHGMDDISIMARTNSSGDFVSLAKGVSGGELSRLMLAFEVVMAQKAHDVPTTFVFDEVDAGVGGETGQMIGRRLAELARYHQVIVITHLAQVACFAQSQFFIEKSDDNEITSTQVSKVTGEERVDELARMLSGTVSDKARAHILELLSIVSVAR
ncbi:MAG: DNA repair protein RecN [Actinomycetaceae bacterium]|nr:DNA repair protein RecN [Actinomycetaceae bacterium]